MKMKTIKGFTLIELMIVVAIIGILMTLAAPMYGDYVTRTSRSDATTALLRMADQQEQYVLRTNAASYTTNLASLGGGNTEHGYYTLSVESATANDYVLVATAVAGGPQSTDAGCTKLKLHKDGLKEPVDCWVK